MACGGLNANIVASYLTLPSPPPCGDLNPFSEPDGTQHRMSSMRDSHRYRRKDREERRGLEQRREKRRSYSSSAALTIVRPSSPVRSRARARDDAACCVRTTVFR